MTSSERYRNLAAALRAKARDERAADLRAEWENLALCYLRLAEQAEQNGRVDAAYEPILRAYREGESA